MTSLTTRPLPDPCDHKYQTGCMLSAIPCCCSCADKRPHAAAYPMYVDGQGMKLQGRRWQRYCRRCRDHWESQQTHIISIPEPPQVLPSTFSATNNMASPSLQFNGQIPNPLQQNPSTTHASTTTHRTHLTSRERRRQNRALIRNVSPSRLARRQYPLGTIEDVQREDYESPIAGMFGRAWTRFRDAEEARRVAQEAGVFDEEDNDDETAVEDTVQSESVSASLSQQDPAPIRTRAAFHRQFYGSSNGIDLSRVRLPATPHSTNYAVSPTYHSPSNRRPIVPEWSSSITLQDPRNAIDRQIRGPSRPTEDLLVNFSCKICLEQKITILCEPCMHAVMCTWCSQLYRQECYRVDGRFDPRLWTCPICRAPITQCRKFYLE